MEVSPGRLHCVTAWSAGRSLGPLIEETLRAHVSNEEVRHLYGEVYLVYTDTGAAAIRDWFISRLQEDESMLVVEFEHWSGYGPAPDRRWLLARGH